MTEDNECMVCYEPMIIDCKLNCKHPLCIECLKKLNKNECPMCRSKLYSSNPEVEKTIQEKEIELKNSEAMINNIETLNFLLNIINITRAEVLYNGFTIYVPIIIIHANDNIDD